MIRDAPRKAMRAARRTRWRARLSPVSRRVSDERLTYLSYPSLKNIERCVEIVGADAIPGDLLEAGVALGGSAIAIATLMPHDRSFHGYDVFGMIPPPGEHDDEVSHRRFKEIAAGRSQGIHGDRYYGYETDLYSTVVDNFSAHGLRVDGRRIVLHKGLFQETMSFRPDQRIAFAHLDGDWYESVRVCLDRIYPHLSPCGFIVSDDYYAYGGCARAVDEFLVAHSDMRTVVDGLDNRSAARNLVMVKD